MRRSNSRGVEIYAEVSKVDGEIKGFHVFDNVSARKYIKEYIKKKVRIKESKH